MKGGLVYMPILTKRLMDDRPYTDDVKHPQSIIDKQRLGGRCYAEYFFLSMIWSYAYLVLGKYSANANFLMYSADRKN